MSIAWLVPAALWGLAALAVPILVHLLTRQERRTTVFPSLRFLQSTRLAAMRRRRIRDWVLLAVRAAIIAAAVAAFATPLLITDARERAWNGRTARAIVAIDEARVPDDEGRSAFRSQVFSPGGRASGSIRSAVEWLAAQPPAARELLIVGDLREGAIDEADIGSIPQHVGIRFVPLTDETPVTGVSLPVLTIANGAAVLEERRVELTTDDTIVEGASARTPASEVRIEVHAAKEEQPSVDAALAALLDEGIVVDRADARRVIVVWPGGAEPGVTGGEAQIVRVSERLTGVAAVQRLRDIAATTLDDPTLPREPRRLSAADLARWSRPAGPSPGDAVRQDEGDRRLLWLAVLALLAVEWLIRRGRAEPGAASVEAAAPSTTRTLDEGGRVA